MTIAIMGKYRQESYLVGIISQTFKDEIVLVGGLNKKVSREDLQTLYKEMVLYHYGKKHQIKARMLSKNVNMPSRQIALVSRCLVTHYSIPVVADQQGYFYAIGNEIQHIKDMNECRLESLTDYMRGLDKL